MSNRKIILESVEKKIVIGVVANVAAKSILKRVVQPIAQWHVSARAIEKTP